MDSSSQYGKFSLVEASSNHKLSFLALPAEIRQTILLFNCPLSISLVTRSPTDNTEFEEIKPSLYELNAKLALAKDPRAKADFEHQIRASTDSIALRSDMLSVIEHRERQLANLDSKVQSILDQDKLCNEWTGALYRLWLRDERVFHEYVYYCFRIGLPLIGELRKAGYELSRLKSMAAQESASSPKASFAIPFVPDGRAARFETGVIKARKRKLSGGASETTSSSQRTSNSPICLRYFPRHTVHFQALSDRNERFPKGPIDEVEDEMIYCETVIA